MGVTEIGLRSLTQLTGVHFGAGVITAVRHAAGTTPRPTDILTRLDTSLDTIDLLRVAPLSVSVHLIFRKRLIK